MSITDSHLAQLHASAIADDVIVERGYRTATTKAELQRLGFGVSQRNVPALVIPSRDVHGEIALYQCRPDTPRIKGGKPIKYETPFGATLTLDVPARVRDQLGNPDVPLWITEGSKKVDSAVSHELTCIGVIGVYGWRGTNDQGGKVALPDFEFIAWNERKVYLAFDSDVMEKPQVHEALRRLADILKSKGANVLYIYIPSPDGRKVGLDDFLADGGTVADLLTTATDTLRRAPGAEPDKEPDGVPRPLDELLEAVADLLGRYVVLTGAQCDALALWTLHTHAFDAADATPYIAITSPEKRSGKTRLLEMLDLLVARPWLTGRTTAAALARKVDKSCPTLLLDESDAAFKGEKEYAETLRGVLNTGHRRGGAVSVCVGKGAEMDVKDFSTFGPKAIAGIGKLPDTVTDRSIPIRMQRKAPGEEVTRFRRREAVAEAGPIQQELGWWSNQAVDQLRDARPDISTELDDRAADGWEPLFAIADMAGDEWSDRARHAAITLSTGAARDDDSLGVKLLATLKVLFQDVERLPTSAIIGDLNGREDEPWGAFNDGAGMRPRDLANMLRRYDVGRRTFRLADGGSVVKGYQWTDLERVCARYVPDTPQISVTSVTSAFTSQKQAEIIGNNDVENGDMLPMIDSAFPHVQANVTDVTDKTPENGHRMTHTLTATPSQGFCTSCNSLLPSAFHRELGLCPACVESSLAESVAAS